MKNQNGKICSDQQSGPDQSRDALFDSWTEKYDRWFETSSGQLVKKYETTLLLELLNPLPGEKILDVGCGSGIFTKDVLNCGARVTGVELSCPMLKKAFNRIGDPCFSGLCGDMRALPFPDDSFDKVFSMTAIEFVKEAEIVMEELKRVTVKGGCIVVTTLNRLSPWAEKRKKKGEEGHPLFQKIRFRSPDEMGLLVPQAQVITTAIHFQKSDPPAKIPEIERNGRNRKLDTGAFLAVQWTKT